jgi:hypothetical protein
MQIERYTNEQGQARIRGTFDIPAPAKGELLAWEETLAKVFSEGERKAIGAGLAHFDTKGQPLMMQGEKWTVQGRYKKVVETPAGPINVERYVYQTSAGGKTFCPSDQSAGLIMSSTPRLAKLVAAKTAEMNATATTRDLELSHQRKASPSFVQDLAVAVSALAGKITPTMEWEPFTDPDEVAMICVGLDSAALRTTQKHPDIPKKLLQEWRMAHVMTIALYDKNKKRLETLYLAGGPGVTAPEGKAAFLARADEVLAQIKARIPGRTVLGISDAAADLVKWLSERVDCQLIDFYHAAEYLTGATTGTRAASCQLGGHVRGRSENPQRLSAGDIA